MRRRRLYILLLAGFSLGIFPAWAQQGTPTSDNVKSAQPKSSTANAKEKPKLAEATRVSTADAARKAAEVKAQGQASDPSSQASGTSEVLEFHAASAQDSVAPATKKGSEKSPLKSAHGDAYGTLDGHGAGKQTGGAVGATSKGGKASIYVETDRSHDTAPAPH